MFVIPCKRGHPIKHNAWIVYSLIIVNLVVSLFTGTSSTTRIVADQFGFTSAKHEPLTIFTSMFIHGNLLHILGNMFFLWMFGESVEDALGSVTSHLAFLGLRCIILSIPARHSRASAPREPFPVWSGAT
jgi:membrane associated rhomboid family serine protease